MSAYPTLTTRTNRVGEDLLSCTISGPCPAADHTNCARYVIECARTSIDTGAIVGRWTTTRQHRAACDLYIDMLMYPERAV